MADLGCQRPESDFARIVDEDIYNELRWMLVAAVTWLGAATARRIPHLKVMAMDSALLHARAIKALLCSQSSSYKNEVVCGDFGVASPDARRWKQHGQAVNEGLLHVKWTRPSVDPVSDKVGDLVEDVVGMWRDFAKSLQPGHPAMADLCSAVLDRALDEADHTARRLGVSNPYR